jgi:DNA polymerase-3 subunit alpha
VQQIERFEPSPEEIQAASERAARQPARPSALRLRLDAQALPASALADLRELLGGFPGDSEVVVELQTSSGVRRLRLGAGFRVARGAALHAELDALLGEAMLSGEADAAELPQAIAASG